MKKLFSSAFLIVVFVSYALSRRTSGSEVVALPPPWPSASLSQGNSADPSSEKASVSSTATVPPVDSSQTQPKSRKAASSRISSAAPPAPPQSSSSQAAQGMYRDGTYVSPSVDAYYGNVQIKVSVRNGQLADVQFLDHPKDRDQSVMINSYAMPVLKSEAIQAQSAPVDIVSGATATSGAFNQALTSVLAQAGN